MAKTEEYILKIHNASPVELVVINYDILLDYIQGALDSSKPEDYIDNIDRAKEALVALAAALDHDQPIALELNQIYVYINTLLMGALTFEKRTNLEEAANLLNMLKESWVKLSEKQPKDESRSKNKIYSGLTYSAKGPNDYVDTDPDRGIKA